MGAPYWYIGVDSRSMVKRKRKDKRIMIQGYARFEVNSATVSLATVPEILVGIN